MKESIVKTSIGQVKGLCQNGVHKFMGIPYAEAPVGELRFADPVPKKPMEGVYDATYERPSAIQSTALYESAIGYCPFTVSEDCLTLKITTPALDKKLPVVVWIHGGANVTGGGNWSWYDGENLSREENVVVVGVNFRIGVLGFLYHSACGAKNFMIHDAVCALKWVKENIAAFGGDPENVTLMGQSAGGNAILYLLQMEETKGLFHRIILESASFSRGCFTEEHAQKISEKMLSLAGIDRSTPETIRNGLRTINLDKLIVASDEYYRYATPDEMSMLFRPVDDAISDPDTQYKVVAQCAKERGIDILMGTNRHERYTFASNTDDPAVQHKLDKERDEMFLRQGLPFARLAADLGLNVYLYEFHYYPKGSPFKACHCLELPFVFGTFDAWANAQMLAGADKAELTKLSRTMMAAWAGFVKTGNPTTDGSWEKLGAQGLVAKIFDNGENPMAEVTMPE